jgi:hypothetical protein
MALRPGSAGKTRNCPHCKALILESATVCPGCHHHLRFGPMAGQRTVAVKPALRVEGAIRHPGNEEPWEYAVVISIRNERDEEVARQVVGVGSLQPSEKRTFSLAVDVMVPSKEVPATTGLPASAPEPSQASVPQAAAPPKPGALVPPTPGAPPPPRPGAVPPPVASAPARSLQPPKQLSPMKPPAQGTKRY